MSELTSISDEQLNALIDNELDIDEKILMMEAISKDTDLQQRYNALQQTKELVALAYTDIPQPAPSPRTAWLTSSRPRYAMAAFGLLMVGVFSGWLMEPLIPHKKIARINTAAEFNVEKPQSETILLHISTTDEARVRAMLQRANTLLTTAHQTNSPLQLEIVANAEGLSILRKDSPYANEIISLTKQFGNVKFLACGIAKKMAALKEGKPIELLSEANDIPAALDQILNRLKNGWTYVGN